MPETVKRMLLVETLLGFLCAVAAVASGTDEGSLTSPPPLLLVSFDGFRADYLKRFPMPNLKNLYSQGVLVEQMTNVFVTKTFPNHYSLGYIVTKSDHCVLSAPNSMLAIANLEERAVNSARIDEKCLIAVSCGVELHSSSTYGLYAESHGIMASNMYDPDTKKHFHISNNSDPSWWNEAEPLWITALDSGYKTAAMMWPGSDVLIHNRTATHYLPYNPHMTFKERVGNVTKWMKGDDKEEGVKFAALYWEQPDGMGHKYGPENTTMMGQTLKEVDDDVGLLMSELKMAGLWGQINVIITSDHGMTQCSPDRLIQLDKCLSPDNYTLVDLTPVAALIPKQDTTAVFSLLKNCHPHMTAYLKESIPERLHYRDNHRVQPIILIADEGWTIVQTGNVLPRLGDHGYDNSLPSMHPFLAAVGPSFRQGYQISSIQAVDVYPLMCRLLSVNGRPNNGTLSHTRCLMSGEKCWDVPLVIGLVVGVLLVLSTVTVLFRFLGWRRPRSIRDFQRLNIDDDDDDPLLE